MRNSDVLQRKFDQVVKTGEVPYQANRRALKVLDILMDGKGGLHEVDITLRGLEMLVEDLKALNRAAVKLRNDSQAQMRKASAVLSIPAYGKLKSVPGFKQMAIRFATIRKAIAEIRKVEDFLLGGQVTKQQLKQGLNDISYFAGVVADETAKAIAEAKAMAKRVSAYERELLDAVG